MKAKAHVTTALMLSLALTGCAASAPSRDGDHADAEACRQEAGCTEQAQPQADISLAAEVPPAETAGARRITVLEARAGQDPRAAFDLGLRFFRGDGVTRDTWRALSWMRRAAEQGHVPAQLALGRLYLSGLEEMGADPAAAESWLEPAARQGNAEARTLLAEARQARRDAQAWQQWQAAQRPVLLGYWRHGYPYYLYWHGGGWRDRQP